MVVHRYTESLLHRAVVVFGTSPPRVIQHGLTLFTLPEGTLRTLKLGERLVRDLTRVPRVFRCDKVPLLEFGRVGEVLVTVVGIF